MKNQNIYVSLRLKKDKEDGSIALNTTFDKNAPNFVTFKHMISWSPTNEEMDFITESFNMITKDKSSFKKAHHNVFVELHIERDNKSGELMLNIYFDNNAPNFVNENDDFSWMPTTEELEFINEALVLFSQQQEESYKPVIETKVDIKTEKETLESEEPETLSKKSKQELIKVSNIEKNNAACAFEDGDDVVNKLISKRKK